MTKQHFFTCQSIFQIILKNTLNSALCLQVCSTSQAHFLNNRSLFHYEWYLLVVILTLNQAHIGLPQGLNSNFSATSPTFSYGSTPPLGLKAMESPAVFCNIVENQIIKHPISLISMISIRGFQLNYFHFQFFINSDACHCLAVLAQWCISLTE